MRLISILILVLSFNVQLVAALTLNQAIDIAFQNNLEIKEQESVLSAAKAKTTYKSWLKQPRLIATYMEIPSSTINPFRAPIYLYGVGQEFPFPYKLWLENQMFSKEEKSRYFAFEAKKREIRSQVVQAYFKLYFFEKKLEINQENLKILDELQSISSTKYRIGQGLYADLLASQIEYEILENENKTLVDEIELAKTQLRKKLNKDLVIKTETLPKGIFSLPPLEKVKQTAKASNLQILALDEEKKSRQDQVLIKKFDYLPDLDLAYLQREAPGTGLKSWDFMLSARIPLWFWAKNAEIGELAYREESLQKEYLNLQNKIEEISENIYLNLKNALRQEETYRLRVLPKNKTALSSAQTAYKNSQMDFISLLSLQKMYRENEIKYYEYLTDLEGHKAKLEEILGTELKGDDL